MLILLFVMRTKSNIKEIGLDYTFIIKIIVLIVRFIECHILFCRDAGFAIHGIHIHIHYVR